MSLITRRKADGLIPSFSNMIESFFNDDDGFFNRWQESRKLPAVNVKETDEAFNLEVAAPGMKKEDFKIEIDNGVLTVSSENKSETEEKNENYTRREFSYSSFSRSFWLPETISEDEIKAEYKNGVLNVMVPKPEPTKTPVTKKTIKID